MPITSRSRRIAFKVWRILVVVLFVIAAWFISYIARGYKLNTHTLRFEATGSIELRGNVADANISYGNKQVGQKLPLLLSGLDPNRYHSISITKPGYSTWRRTIAVEPEIVSRFHEIRLWPSDLKAERMQNQNEIHLDQICQKNEKSAEQKLVILGGEIRTTTNLITRISRPVTHACWFSDRNHIAYVVDKEVRVVEADGQNDTLLVTMNSAPTAVAPASNEVVYIEQEGFWRVTIDAAELRLPLPGPR